MDLIKRGNNREATTWIPQLAIIQQIASLPACMAHEMKDKVGFRNLATSLTTQAAFVMFADIRHQMGGHRIIPSGLGLDFAREPAVALGSAHSPTD